MHVPWFQTTRPWCRQPFKTPQSFRFRSSCPSPLTIVGLKHIPFTIGPRQFFGPALTLSFLQVFRAVSLPHSLLHCANCVRNTTFTIPGFPHSTLRVYVQIPQEIKDPCLCCQQTTKTEQPNTSRSGISPAKSIRTICVHQSSQLLSSRLPP